MAYLGQILQLLKLLGNAAWGFVMYKSGKDAAENKQLKRENEANERLERKRNDVADNPTRNSGAMFRRLFGKD